MTMVSMTGMTTMTAMMMMRSVAGGQIGECKPQVEPQLNTNMTDGDHRLHHHCLHHHRLHHHHHHHHHYHEDPLGMIRISREGPGLCGHPDLGGANLLLSQMASFCSQDQPTNPPHPSAAICDAMFSLTWDQTFSIMHLFRSFLCQVLMPKKLSEFKTRASGILKETRVPSLKRNFGSEPVPD